MNHSTSISNHIWVIDDDQSIRWVLDRALTNAGFNVGTFETASKALAQFKRVSDELRPALILTDFRMPGINGFELQKQIKNLEPDLPVIIMTAYADLDTTVEAYQEGAFEYLAKPFDIDDAISQVTNAFRERQLLRKKGDIFEGNTSETNVVNSESMLAMSTDWKESLQHWADEALASGETGILTESVRELEKILIESALRATRGRKQDAARLLGWGRNTLTRKLKEHY